MRDGPSCQPRAIRMSNFAIIGNARKTAQLHSRLMLFPLRHPGLDPGSMTPPLQWTPDQVRGDENGKPLSSRQLLRRALERRIEVLAKLGKDDIIAARPAD